MSGPLVTFNSKLTVISGFGNKKKGGSGSSENVEVFENESGQWNVSSIQKAPEKFSKDEKQLALVVTENRTDTLFFFGGYFFFIILLITLHYWELRNVEILEIPNNEWVKQYDHLKRSRARLVLFDNVLLLVGRNKSSPETIRFVSFQHSYRIETCYKN